MIWLIVAFVAGYAIAATRQASRELDAVGMCLADLNSVIAAGDELVDLLADSVVFTDTLRVAAALDAWREVSNAEERGIGDA